VAQKSLYRKERNFSITAEANEVIFVNNRGMSKLYVPKDTRTKTFLLSVAVVANKKVFLFHRYQEKQYI
jgi:hypothetical protein